jgi:hypothetical protein
MGLVIFILLVLLWLLCDNRVRFFREFLPNKFRHQRNNLLSNKNVPTHSVQMHSNPQFNACHVDSFEIETSSDSSTIKPSTSTANEYFDSLATCSIESTTRENLIRVAKTAA